LRGLRTSQSRKHDRGGQNDLNCETPLFEWHPYQKVRRGTSRAKTDFLMQLSPRKRGYSKTKRRICQKMTHAHPRFDLMNF
jgi:hypothetical protein